MEKLNLDNNILNFKIDNLNINGEAIIQKENKKYCVKGVLPKEEVEVTQISEKKNFVNTKLNKIIKESPLRISPPCPIYDKCGGCNFQYISTENALIIKKDIIKNYFSLLYNKEIIEHKSKKDFGYRNKASFLVKNSKIGYQIEETNNLVEVDNCLILNPLINKALKIIKVWLEKIKNNNITHIVIRVLDNKLSIVVVSKKEFDNFKNLIAGLKNEFLEGNFGLYLNINTEKNKILSPKFNHIYGLETLETSFNEIKYFVHPYSFMQVNDDVKNSLYESILSKINNLDIIVEGYSGAGLLSAIMAKKAKKVFSVEINNNATKDANFVKKKNLINNLENINGDCKIILPKLIKDNNITTFVIDPPRSGCDNETLKAVKDANIPKIIYVSCNPYTLKQNLVFLSDKYDIESIEIFDMFPQTFHVELLVVLSLKDYT